MWYDARSLALLLDFTNLSSTVKVTALSQTGHTSAGNMHSYDVHVAHMCGSSPVDSKYQKLAEVTLGTQLQKCRFAGRQRRAAKQNWRPSRSASIDCWCANSLSSWARLDTRLASDNSLKASAYQIPGQLNCWTGSKEKQQTDPAVVLLVFRKLLCQQSCSVQFYRGRF